MEQYECIVRDEKSILPVSSIIYGSYGIEDIALSMPAIVGLNEIETHVPVSLNDEETKLLRHTEDKLRNILSELEL